ncbi:16S rRNA (guanine(966)-N(2))-methyltransferase RsmD [Caldicellulosiruptoraceae bacterium PP1]
MRVISGCAKGKRLKSIETESLRPTADRVKEALFNIIAPYLDETTIVGDFFAGTGNIGIEFLSRGVKEAIFVENDLRCINIIKENLKYTNLDSKAKVLRYNVLTFLRNSYKEYFDIIFVDPPYMTNLAQKTLESIFSENVLKKDGFVIVEYSKNNPIFESNFRIIRTEKYGDTILSFLKYGG